MEKLIHTPEGELKSTDRARIVGTKYRSVNRGILEGIAEVTEECVKNLDDETIDIGENKPIIWGVWGSLGDQPAWSYQDTIEFIDD